MFIKCACFQVSTFSWKICCVQAKPFRQQHFKMKLFQTFKRDIVMLGINLNQPNNKEFFNENIFVSISLCVLCMILTGVFICCEANTFIEYTEPIYLLSAAVIITNAFVHTIIKIQMIFEYIGRFEKIVNSSK